MLSRAHRRLEREKEQIKRDHITLEIIIPDDENLQWKVLFDAPKNSIYEDEKFV